MPKNGRQIRRFGEVRSQRRLKGVTGLLPFLRTQKSTSIWGDFKVLVQQVLIENPHPLPDTKNISATLRSKNVFSKIDFSNAYQQNGTEREQPAIPNCEHSSRIVCLSMPNLQFHLCPSPLSVNCGSNITKNGQCALSY